ncbi:hypothetical protein P5V15_005192 [Pogonomyrmex californicus]
MIGILLHVLFLLGKRIYERYRGKTKILHYDSETEFSLLSDELHGEPTEEMDLLWKDKTVHGFFPPAYIQRYCAVTNVLNEYNGKLRKIVDFGCAEMGFLVYLKRIPGVEEVLCVDVDHNVLERFHGRAAPLTTEFLDSARRNKFAIEVCLGSVTDNDEKLQDVDAVTCIELIEHLYPDTLMDLPFNIFGYIKPQVVVVTTPNVEFNVLFPNFSGYRHPDHKFEWTRKQFQDWAQNIVVRYPYYRVTFHDICNGPEGTKQFGPLTQMAVFHRILSKSQSGLEVLISDEYFELKGRHGLFKTVVKYNYPMRDDTRSDERKILDEAIYYINFLSYSHTNDENVPHRYYEINLDRLSSFITKYNVTTEALRTILTNGGWTVVDRENGPVVLNPSEHPSDNETDDEMLYFNDIDIVTEEECDEDENEDWHDETNVINKNEWDYVSDLNETSASANNELALPNLDENFYYNNDFICEENKSENESDELFNSLVNGILPNMDDEDLSMQNPHTENWLEEPSIIIPENCSINQENSYLFNGENSLLEESRSPEKLCAICGNDNAKIQKLINFNKELSDDSIPLILDNPKAADKFQTIASKMSSALPNNLQLKKSIDNITSESTLLQNDQIDSATQEVTSMLNLQPCMFISRSSASLYSYSDLTNSSHEFDSNSYESELLNNQIFLNNTLQSKMATKIDIMKDMREYINNMLSTAKNLPERDRKEKGNRGCFLSPIFPVEQEQDISDYQSCEDSDVTDVVTSDAYNNLDNQPKYTSSPSSSHTQRFPADTRIYPECTELMNTLDKTLEFKRKLISDITNFLDDSQRSDNTTETIKLCETSNNDIKNTEKYNLDFSASNSIQQEASSEYKELNDTDDCISTKLIYDKNEKFTENDIINHESDIVNDIENVDAQHILSLDNKSTNHKNENACCTLASTLTKLDIDTEAPLENVISDHAQSNARKKDINPPRELLNSKSKNVSKYSPSECAKEFSILKNDRFVSCNEDTSNVTSVLKNEETVGTSKEISNISGLVNNIEAKSSSPLETPPNSWSPEIMDSGYPNSTSAQDITPEYDLSSIAQDHIPDSESPSVAEEAPRLGVLELIEVENGDLANNNRDDEGNNMVAMNANDIENLQPLIDVLENDLENENDIYVMQNGFPIWLLRLLDMANPLDFDIQARQNLRVPDEAADDGNYVIRDEGFDSSSSESESDVADNEVEHDDSGK